MHLELFRLGMLVGLSVITGWTGWSGHVFLLPVVVAFPLLWSLAQTRAQAAAVSAAYFLTASRGLPQGVANFYGQDIWPGLLLWLVASSAFVAVHSMLWTERKGWHKPLRYLAACGAMAIPPFGILGWAHPITAAGVFFPGSGWWGLSAMTAGLAVMTTHHRPAAAMAMTGLWLWSAAEWTTPVLPASWIGVDLKMGASLGRDSGLERHRELAATAIGTRNAGVIVMPESALGYWTPTVQRLWQRQLSGTGITVIAGAAVVNPAGYDNVLVRVTDNDASVLYRERMPVPGSMWQPWRSWSGQPGGAGAHLFSNPVVSIGATSIAPLICYEQLIVWPILQSMLADPDIILAVGNGWWTAGTSIVDIQDASASAWAMLFGKPLVMSFNF